MKRFTSTAGSLGSSMASFGGDSLKKANSLASGLTAKPAATTEPTAAQAVQQPAKTPYERNTDRPLRILSLDGGGVRGYSTLIILKRFMLRLGARQPEWKDKLPADYFDLIIGTSTGGIIALMLGRLRMSVEQAIKAYQALSKKIFSGGIASAVLGGSILSDEDRGLGLGMGIVKGRDLDQYLNMARTTAFADETAMYDATKLEKYLKHTIANQVSAGHNEDAPLEDDDPKHCYTAIVTARQNNATAAIVMRSYNHPTKSTDEKLTIWQAARATSAAPAFFAPITLGYNVKFVDGAVTGHCNPSEIAREEAEAVFENRNIGLLLSLGTGAPTSISLAGSNTSKLASFIALSANTAQVHERTFRHFHLICGGDSPYVRISVDSKIDKVRLDDYEQLDNIAAETENYLDSERVRKELEDAVDRGDRKNGEVPDTSFSRSKSSRNNSIALPVEPTETGA